MINQLFFFRYSVLRHAMDFREVLQEPAVECGYLMIFGKPTSLSWKLGSSSSQIHQQKKSQSPGTGLVMVPMKYRALVLQLFKNEAIKTAGRIKLPVGRSEVNGWPIEKNKMKPTNPNADTYVEEQKQYLFITFSSEPTCGTPWRDTLRWHSCRTPFLLDTLVRHSYLTLF